MSKAKQSGPIRNTIEFIAPNPARTGLLAILGAGGFAITAAGFTIDREDPAATTEQDAAAQATLYTLVADVSEADEATPTDCSGPPCWSLREFAQPSTIGRPKDLIDRKLPAPEGLRNGTYRYKLDDCQISVEYTDDAVSYFSVSLAKNVAELGPDGKPSGTFTRQPCDIDVQGLTGAPSPLPAPDRLAMSDLIAALEPENRNTSSPLNLQIASACLDCGNFAEPYLELMRFGPHAADFVNLHVTTDFRPAAGNSGIGDSDLLLAFRERMRAKIGPEAKYGVETQPLCGQNLASDVSTLLGPARVTAIGLGKGARSWTNVLYCEWWN